MASCFVTIFSIHTMRGWFARAASTLSRSSAAISGVSGAPAKSTTCVSGGRDSLRVMAILYLISALGCAFAWDWYSLVFFRFIGGLGIGGSSVLGPMYIAEIAPAKWRGRMVGLFQFNVVFGILLAYFS